jgi:hypothetical protein
MMSRKELEMLLGHPISDEAWEENKRIFAEAQEKMWDEDHPLDE